MQLGRSIHRGPLSGHTQSEDSGTEKHESVVIIAEREREQEDHVASPTAGESTEQRVHSPEASSLALWVRFHSLAWTERVTLALLFCTSASLVLNQCSVARADIEHRRYIKGAFGISSVVSLTWCITIMSACFLHHLVLPLSLSATGEKQLNAAAEFSAYMVGVFVCQNTMLIRRRDKAYDRDLFGALMMTLLVAAVLTLRRIPRPVARPKPASVEPPQTAGDKGKKESLLSADEAPHSAKNEETSNAAQAQVALELEKHATAADGVYHISPLCREQTTEWRGWMQVLFLYYHYFHATEVYNAARLCVSAYVWMTGYGNFFFYTRQKNFGLLRFTHTMWRLNFLSLCLCGVLGNQFMLYYICPMHTLFTLCLYVSLYIRQDMNTSRKGVVTKMAVLTVISVVVWDLGDVSTKLFRVMWWPLTWFLRYDNPVGTVAHPLAEWQYRTGLDHLVWIAGMGFAHFHPTYDAWLRRLDAMPAVRGAIFKAIIGTAAVVATLIYAKAIYLQDRSVYNKWHPYTSFIPLTLYLVLRNLSQRGRMYYSGLLYSLGNVTLETYLLQFHVWMSMVTVNGPPRKVLELISGGPLCNFVLFSCLLVAVSERIFRLVQTVESVMLPGKAPDRVTLGNICFSLVVVALSVILLWPGERHFSSRPYTL